MLGGIRRLGSRLSLLLAVAALAGAPSTGRAQASPWTARLFVQPFPSPFMADWERNPQTAALTLLYRGTAPTVVHIEGYLTSAERGELARVQSPAINVDLGPITLIMTSADILDWQTVSRDQQYVDQVIRTGMIPEGRLQMCARVLSAQNVELTRACSDFSIAHPAPPQLVFPAQGAVVSGAMPVFQWTPVMLPPQIGTQYQLRIVEQLDGQTPETAIRSNPVWHETMSAMATAIYPTDALPLDPGKTYAWSVQVLDGEGNPVTRGGASSETWTFTVGGPSRGGTDGPALLPDTLTLVPGFARLVGLSRMEVTATPFAFVLNGAADLELEGPVSATVRMQATDLELDRATLLSLPTVRSGDLTGTLREAAAAGNASWLRFTDVSFGPEGLTLGASLAVPGAPQVALTGRAQLNAAGLFGTLTVEGTSDQPVVTFGADPLEFAVRSASVTLPDGSVTLAADLHLFGKDVGCGGVPLSLDGGVLTATLACSPNKPVALVGDNDRFRLALSAVSGRASMNLADGTLTYAVDASGELRLDAGIGALPGANCAAALTVSLADGKVSVPSFSTRCNASEGEARLGWLHARLSSLALDHLTYAAGQGFDFALKVSLAPWVPDIPGIELPVLDTVLITQVGLAIPAADVAVNRPPVSLGGFALTVTRVRLPAFTLAWSDWQIGSPKGFAFSLDGQVSLPELPAGVGSCLASPPIAVTGVELSGGRLKAHFDERRFTPPCTLVLSAPASAGGGTTSDTSAAAGAAGDPMGPVRETVRPPADAAASTPNAASPMAGAITGESPKDNPFAMQASELAELQRHDEDRQRRLADPQCDATCVQHVFDEELKERQGAWTRWHNRVFSELDSRTAACTAPGRQTGILTGGDRAFTSDCDRLMTNGADSVLGAAIVSQSSLPQRPAVCDPLCEHQYLTQKDCRNEVDFVAQEYLKVAAVHVKAGAVEAQESSVLATQDYCLKQAQQRYEDACVANSSPAQRQYQLALYIRQRDQYQTAGNGAEVPFPEPKGACAPQPASVTSLRDAAPPGTAAPPPLGLPPPPDVDVRSGPQAGAVESAWDAGNAVAVGASAAGTVRLPSGMRLAPSGESGGVRLELERFGGDLVVSLYPRVTILSVPEIEGSVVLPSLFQCADASAEKQPLLTKLRLGPHGEVDGTVTGFVPGCPVNLAAVRVQAKNTSLSFSTAEGRQAVVLTGSVTASFTLGSDPVTAEGEIALDLLAGRLIGGSLAFQGPLQLGLPREVPVVSFTLASARLDTLGIHVDGRATLALPDSQGVNVTFDNVTIDPATAGLRSGRVVFDASFGFEVGIASDGTLGWRAVARGAALAIQTGIRVDLPSQAVLDSSGFRISGDGGAHLVFQDRDVDGLTAHFSSDFALSLAPPKVAAGSVDFQKDGISLGFVDGTGFHPNLAYLASALIPERLGLPDEAVAYLELRDADGTLRVQTEATPAGRRVFTAPGVTIPLVIPALQLGRAQAPRLGVAFDLTVDPVSRAVTGGALHVALAPGDAAAFDLSALGLPIAIDTIAFDAGANGTYRLAVGGALTLLGQKQKGADGSKVLLTLDAGGLAGQVNLQLDQTIPLVPGSSQLTLAVKSVSGTFSADLAGAQLKYDLDADGSLALDAGAGGQYRADATVEVANTGVSVKRLSLVGADTTRYLDLGAVRVGLKNLRVPTLSFDPAAGFRFELLFDVVLNFPSLKNLTLPPIANVSLRNDGFTIPAWEVTDLQLDTAAFGASPVKVAFIEDTLKFGGFVLKPLAFRMRETKWNWFGGQPPADWGFGFDVEFRFANLMAGAPASVQNVRLRLLDAGFRNGRLYGSLERVDFPTPEDIGIGELYAIWGRVPPPPDPPTAQGAPAPTQPDTAALLAVEVNLNLQSALPFCPTAVTSSNDTLAVYSDGFVAGRIHGVVPKCSGQLGPFTFAFGNSELFIGGAPVAVGAPGTGHQRRVELEAEGRISLPVASGDSVTATGTVRFDLLTGRMLSGRIDVDRPFRWQPPGGNPYLAFDVDKAFFDSAGMHFTGGGKLRLADGASVGVTFTDLVIGLPDLKVKSGSVTFTNAFALGASIGEGGLVWGAYSLTTPRPSGNGVRITLPPTVTLDASGLKLDGSASASLTFNGQDFATLQASFHDGFAVGFAPLAVSAGRVDLILNGTEVAHVDQGGFWPGNVLGVLPIPARLGVPSEDIAYVQLRDPSNALLIETASSSSGLELRTKAGAQVQLVVPALAGQGQSAPSFGVAFDVVVNPATFQLVSGSVQVSATGAAPLLSLDNLGLPIEIRALTYDANGLRLGARIELPAALSTADLRLTNLTLTRSGLTGTADVGTYSDTYNPQAQPFKTVSLTPDLSIDFVGLHASFGATPEVKLSGVLHAAIFASSSGTPVPLPFSAQVSTAGVTMSVDPGKAGSPVLPLAVATFEPAGLGGQPAIRVTADAKAFTLRLSGVVRVPALGPAFAVTLDGLEVGTGGVKVPTMSVSGVGQQFTLFGATFALRDSVAGGAVVYPALTGGYTNGDLSLSLSGDLTFLENTSRFVGLTVTSHGAVNLAGANLLSRQLALVPGVLTVDRLAVQNGHLNATLGVTLPAPLDGRGPQQAVVDIGPDGTITGGAKLTLIDEAAAAPGGTSTMTDVGVAWVHVRRVGLSLDLANLKTGSAVDVVADLYFQHDLANRVQLGDVVGGVVKPGLHLGFDGTVAWGNVAIAGPITLDWDAVRLQVTKITTPSTGAGFAISLGGNLSLALAEVQGALAFHDFVLTSQGQVQFGTNTVEGGSLSIPQIATLEVSEFDYRTTPTTIDVKTGGMPASGQAATTGTESVAVSSYVHFGGKLTVVGVFQGGVDEFLAYRTTDQRAHLLIRNASLAIQDVVAARADLRYDENPGGFAMTLGAQGQLFKKYDVALVGAFGRDQQTPHIGIFVATSGLNIVIPGVPITITGLGGGFFLNPRPDQLDLVRSLAGVSQTAGAKVSAPAGSVAGLLYGAAAIVDENLVKGKVLLTVSDAGMQLDGAVEVLSQGEKFAGDAHLAIGFKQAYAQGDIALQVKYASVVEGTGSLGFYVYGPSAWGIVGATRVKLMGFLDGSSSLFIGPPGFVLQASIKGGFDVWVLKIDNTFDGKVWYRAAANEWGGFVSVGVEASVLNGLASITGTLKGVLLLNGSPSLYAAAQLEGQAAGQKWKGTVWAQFVGGQASAGFGDDAAMDAAIASAEAAATEMTAAQDASKTAMQASAPGAPGTVALSNQELAQAYQALTGWNTTTVAILSAAMEASQPVMPGEGAYQKWYFDVLARTGLPGDSAAVKANTDAVANQVAALTNQLPTVEARLAALSVSVSALAPAAAPAIPADPVRALTFDLPTTTDRVNADGLTERVPVGGPQFDLDANAAQAARAAMEDLRGKVEAADGQVRDRIAALDAGVTALRGVTSSSDASSYLSYAKAWADAGAAAERQFAAQADLVLQRQDWMRTKLAELAARDTTATRWITGKTAAIRAGLSADDAVLAMGGLASARIALLSKLSRNATLITQYTADSLRWIRQRDPAARVDSFAVQTNQIGLQLWVGMARAGLIVIAARADTQFTLLQQTAAQRLGALRQSHASLSQSLAGLYAAQADAVGALYDLYDRYLFWRTGSAASAASPASPATTPAASAPTADDLKSVDAVRTRHDALALDLAVPRVNSVQVAALATTPYTAQLQFTVSAWHPSGTTGFLFNDVDGSGQALGTSFLSNGVSGTIVRSYFTPDRSRAATLTRTFQAGARGGAGFVGYGRANYTLTFGSGPGVSAAVTGGTLLPDATAPTTPVVTFVGHTVRAGANLTPEIWTSNPDQIDASWSADDPESGVAGYEVALWSSPTGAGTALRAFWSVGGRTSLTIDRLGLTPGGPPVYVAVRAKNPGGLSSSVGVSAAVRLDPTPPAFAVGVALQVATPGARAIAIGGLAPGATIPTSAACPVPAPAASATTPALTADVPGVRLTAPAASDAESGVEAYWWKAGTQPEAAYSTTGWTRMAAPPTFDAFGAPFAYTGQFYVSVVVTNYAGAASPPLVYGPFQVSDNTPPTDPAFCVALAGTADRLVAQFSTWSGDAETGLAGYQYRVRTAAGALVRAWPASGVDWVAQSAGDNLGVVRATAPLTLTGGQSYLLDVRSENGRGAFGMTQASGPFLYDVTAPPTPTVSVGLRTGTKPAVTLSVTTPNDPESGIARVEITVGTRSGTSDLLAWTTIAGAAAGSFSGVLPVTVLPPRSTLYIRVRSFNGVGTSSALAQTTLTTP